MAQYIQPWKARHLETSKVIQNNGNAFNNVQKRICNSQGKGKALNTKPRYLQRSRCVCIKLKNKTLQGKLDKTSKQNRKTRTSEKMLF